MPLQDDATIPAEATLYRVLPFPSWVTTEQGVLRPTSAAFYEGRGEVSYLLDGPGVLDEIRRLYPSAPIAALPASTLREVADYVIVRRPDEASERLRDYHVVVGASNEITKNDSRRRAKSISRHDSVRVIPPP
jgi:hypothetical protein